jgi:hypothetical protein
MGRGEFVALLDAAPGDLCTLTGTLRRWTHRGRMRTAFERARDARVGRGSVLGVLSVGSDTSPETTDTSSHVWYSAPNRWRVEGDDTTLYVSDGEQRWEGFTGFVTERSGPGEVPTLGDSPRLADWMLPGALLGAFRFGEVTDVEVLGRRCLAATAEQRPVGSSGTMGVMTSLAQVGYGGDENRFVVDAQHGFVVRRTALLDGEPCSITELTRLVVDEPTDPGLFRVPAGTTIQTLAEERARMLRDAGVDPAGVDLADGAALSRALADAHGLAVPAACRSPSAHATWCPGSRHPRTRPRPRPPSALRSAATPRPAPTAGTWSTSRRARDWPSPSPGPTGGHRAQRRATSPSPWTRCGSCAPTRPWSGSRSRSAASGRRWCASDGAAPCGSAPGG